MDEAREARLLVALEEVDAGRRARPEHADGESTATLPSAASWRHRRPADEEHRGERGEVHERRAEVGLREHEERPGRAEPEHAQRRRRARRSRAAVGEEAGEREHEQRACRTPTAGSVKKPSEIQRVEPRAAWPTTKTNAINEHVPAKIAFQ